MAKQRILKVINYWSQKWFIIICFLARLPSSSLSSFFLSHTPIIRERKKAKNKKEDKEEYICVWTRRNLDLDFAFLHFPLLIICLRKWKKKGRDPGYVLGFASYILDEPSHNVVNFSLFYFCKLIMEREFSWVSTLTPPNTNTNNSKTQIISINKEVSKRVWRSWIPRKRNCTLGT